MLAAVVACKGGMAQFRHPEFGGSGQWMSGGAVMISDMFNNALKARVDALCNELAGLVRHDPSIGGGGSFQSQAQGPGGLGGGSMSGLHVRSGAGGRMVAARLGNASQCRDAEQRPLRLLSVNATPRD